MRFSKVMPRAVMSLCIAATVVSGSGAAYAAGPRPSAGGDRTGSSSPTMRSAGCY